MNVEFEDSDGDGLSFDGPNGSGFTCVQIHMCGLVNTVLLSPVQLRNLSSALQREIDKNDDLKPWWRKWLS